MRLAAFGTALLALGCVNLTPPEPVLMDGAARDGRATEAPRTDAASFPSVDASEVDGTPADAEPIDPDSGGALPDGAPAPDGPVVRSPDAPADAPVDRPPDSTAEPPALDAALLANGSACSAGGQCQTGFCAQDRCCDQACGAACYACDLPAAPGSCRPIPAGEPSRGACSAQPASGCGLDGTCNGAGACRQHVAGTTCGAASCTGATETGAATCDGQGACQAGASRGCGQYLCDPGTATCRTSCAQADQCQAGFTCAGSACVTASPINGLLVNDTDATRAALWSVEANFQIGQAALHPWADWPNTYLQSIDPAATLLLGDQWLRVSAESKKYTGGPQARMTLTRTTDLYMFVDDRWPTTPWLMGWTATGLTATIFESSSNPSLRFHLFRRTVAAGDFDLPGIGSNAAYNYFIVAK